MVLAAGAGTRLRPLTYEIPKPMAPVLNRPVIHYALANLARHGIRDVVANLHAHPRKVRRYCGSGDRWGINLSYSYEPRLMGTAGAVKRAERFLKKGPFFVLSGDGFTDIDLDELYAFHRRRGSMATMAVKEVDSRFDYGITLASKTGRIRGFIEKPTWGQVFSNKVNTGIYVFEPEVLRYIPKDVPFDFARELWPKLLKLGKPLYAFEWRGYWCDVGNLGELRRCQMDALGGHVGVDLPGREIKKGVHIERGTRIHPHAKLLPPCLIGQGTHIEAGAKVGPFTVVGHGCSIGAGASVKNSILFDHVVVGRQGYLSDCIVGEKSSVHSDIAIYGAAILNVRE